MARLYWDKHGVESLSIRIGSCLNAPKTERHLFTWLSYDDLVSLLEAGLSTKRLGCRIVWGASANAHRWWRDHGLSALGYRPKHNAEAAVALIEEDQAGDSVALRYQGGAYCSSEYTRTDPSPADIFAWMKED
jgi:uronate dehydrogenase